VVQLVGLGVVGAALVVSACSGTDAPVFGDGGADASVDAAAACVDDEGCDDGLFCNGAERCAPASAGADPRGCVSAPDGSPCADGEVCDEEADACERDSCADPDADGDGHERIACGGDDCDDGDANRFPGNTEVCDVDDADEDCDPRTFGVRDLDGDGETDALCCNVASDGSRRCGPDCDDSRPSIGTTATEVCNGHDDDCDGAVDEDALATYYADCDGDGQGTSAGSGATSCGRAPTAQGCPGLPPAGYSTNSTDCRDDDSYVFLGATEICDSKDNDCDGTIDEDVTPNTYYRDSDGDRWVVPTDTVTGCSAPAGYIALTTPPTVGDCDDADPTINPGAAQRCGSIDTDCDPGTPSTTPTWYADCDADGYSPLEAASRTQCDPPAEPTGCPSGGQWQSTYPITVAGNVDCNDTVPSVHPGADELCDGYDTDCRRVSTHGLDFLHEDDDDDGWADCAGLPLGRFDCNDGDGSIHPAATETVADGVDYDCDGLEVCYRDGDGDGYRTSMTVSSAAVGCPTAAGLALSSQPSGDCCDGDARAYPGATMAHSTERVGCGGYDFDCDGASTPQITGVSSGSCGTVCEGGFCDCVESPDLYGWSSTVPACGEPGTLVVACRIRSTGACGGVYTRSQEQECL